MFVPGFMQRGEAWAPVARRVAERYPTMCLDFESHTLEERLAELRAVAPRGAVVVGYSMGGRLALQAAVREPERYGALVLVGATAGIEGEQERGARFQADLRLASRLESQSIEHTVAEWEQQPVFEGQPPELVAAQRPGRLSHRPADLASLLRTAGQGAVEPVWDRIPSLPMPVLAIAGERDTRYMDLAARIAELAPWGRAAIVPGGGHAAHLERPARVAALILELVNGSA